jgi:predicted negative regulator of RcsB-dependent stress response
MKRFLPASLLVCGALLLPCSPARAQDTVYLKDAKKSISGIVTDESAKGVQLKGHKDLIPAQSIRDIEYDVQPTELRLSVYRPAVALVKKAVEAAPDQRLKLLEPALKACLAAVPKLARQPFAQTQTEYQVANLYTLKAEADGKQTSRFLAVTKLKDFKTKHPNAWQTPGVLVTLAKLQVEQKDFDEAGQTLKALTEAPVSEDIRQNAELMIARLPLAAGRYEQAEKKLAALAAKLPPGSVFAQRAQLGQAEALAALKKLPEAKGLLQKLLKETQDRDARATAYNTLGYCDLQAGQVQDALWAFLWVDVIYNQNKEEHARALYYLHQVFTRLNDGEHAQECLDALLHDRQYEGLEYQRKAQEEQHKAGP